MRLIEWRPLNGWRAFAGEIGVVTLGVLIALLAQQVAQEVDWRNRAAGARAALRPEMIDHYQNAIEWRATEPCIAAQLDALERRVLASGDRLTPAPMHHDPSGNFVVRTPSRTYLRSAWEGAVSEGVSSHLRPGERAAFADQYNAAANIGPFGDDLSRLVSRLDVMSQPIPLDAGVRLSLLQTIAEARSSNELISLVAGQMIRSIVQLGIADRASAVVMLKGSGTYRFCRDRRLPLRPLSDAAKPLS